jgi:uncharacterized membrane protein YdjX (TVP38/TMEM64 family)
VAIGLLILAAILFLYSRVDIDRVHQWTEALDSWLVFLLIVVLPLVGFPVSVVHMLAGIRWGTAVGLQLVVISIALQLLASFALVHLFRPVFEKRLEKVRRKIPAGAHGPVCLFTMLLPGVPYFAKNYVLPLVGVPLRTYLLWCFPLHALRSSVGVMFGDASDELTPQRIAFFVVYGLTIAAACTWAFRRIREKAALQDSPATSR